MDDDNKQRERPNERRNMYRLSFTAAAELIDVASKGLFSVRMADVGTGG